jgi:hypothetical protein
MPIPPPPMTFSCPSCGWKKPTTPRSDALVIGVDWFNHCPECGREDLTCEVASPPASALTRLKQLLGL